MGLRGWLLTRSFPRPFLVTAVGGTAARLAVERVLRERGWRRALSPGEADLLVVCGPAGSGVDESVERVWRQISGPRAQVRVEAGSAPEAAARLDEARVELLDTARRDGGVPRNAATDAPSNGSPVPHSDSAGTGDHDPDPSDHGGGGDHGDGHGGDHEGGHDHGGGHEHHHGDMEMPGGLPMADRGADRDGLTLDRLHVALGPALPDWPAGLLVRLTIQGDVVQEAEASTVRAPPGDRTAFWDAAAGRASAHGARVRAAAAADSAQRLLSVAGWPGAAATGRWLRDELLTPESRVVGRPRFLRWVRAVRRSRLLRWSTNGLGDTSALLLPASPGSPAGGVTAVWSRWLDEVEAVLDPGSGRAAGERSGQSFGRERAEHARVALEALPTLLAGRELAAARLIVAALDPDLEALATHLPGTLHD